MKMCYVAGPLNSDAVGYINNIRSMNKWASFVQRELGYDVVVPGNDIVYGLVNEGLGYDSYFNNNLATLFRADAIFMSSGWEKSAGCNREHAIAQSLGIPIMYYDKPDSYKRNCELIVIVGNSGVGKSTLADALGKVGIPLLKGFTTRPRRDDYDNDYHFINDDTETYHALNSSCYSFDDLLRSGDVMTWSIFGGYKYFNLKGDAKGSQCIIVDEVGLDQVVEAASMMYIDYYSVYMYRDIVDADADRIDRDKDRQLKHDEYYWMVIHNNGYDGLMNVATKIKGKIIKGH